VDPGSPKTIRQNKQIKAVPDSTKAETALELDSAAEALNPT
jgi:hypothetical protein